MILDQRDFDFLFRWLELDRLLERDRFSACTADDARAVVAAALDISQHELAGHLRASDTHEPSIDAAGNVSVLDDVARSVRLIGQAGLFSTIFDADDGGFQLPHLVHVAALGSLMAGNLATASFPLLTVGNAGLLCRYASKAQKSAFAEPQIAGEAMGTMCLSEPQAGSSLGDIRTRAVHEASDELGERYRIFGNKMWISGGDQNITSNIIHLVLAKIPDADGNLPEGTKGISLFIVPKILPDGSRNDVIVSGLNHKMGYRGLPNAAMNFGEGAARPAGAAGAIGWLVGEAGNGLAQMFHMMNEARTSVGLAAAMLACRGYQMSLSYARERLQGRLPGSSGGPQVAIIEHPDVRRMLLAQKSISQGAASLVLYSARLLDEEKTGATPEARTAAAERLALLTPITKSWPSEWAQVSLHHALQIHGGSGYTRDFDVEILYRDNRLNPIHEGTTGIQGLDLVGRKIRRDGGKAFARLAADIRTTADAARRVPRLAAAAEALERALRASEDAVDAICSASGEALAVAHATPVLNAIGHLVVGWLWLDQVRLAASDDAGLDEFSGDFIEGRTRAALYFSDTELPEVEAWLLPLQRGSDTFQSMTADQF